MNERTVFWILDTDETLDLDSTIGHMKNKKFMKNYWGRDYEKGWGPKI